MNINSKFIEYIINFINSDQKLNKLFKHHKQKYSINDMFDALLYKLNTGISYNNISDVFKHIKGGNLHYFHKKIIKYDIFVKFYDYYTKTYVDNLADNLTEFYIDSTLIANKQGIDLVTNNIQLKKHKSSKITIITDDFKVPLYFKLTDSNKHDSSVCYDELDIFSKRYPLLCTNNKKFIADAGYDSTKIEQKLKDNNLGVLICDKNKRNTKNPEKLKNLKLDLYSKMLLRKRSKIEHVNNSIKHNKTINIRYEKYSKYYNSFVLIAICKIAFIKIGNIEKYL
jgi:hypothetical protein